MNKVLLVAAIVLMSLFVHLEITLAAAQGKVEAAKKTCEAASIIRTYHLRLD